MYAALVLVSLTPGQCANGVCPPAVAVASAPGYEWRTRADDPGRYYLFRGSVQLGGYDVAGNYYRACDPAGLTWGPPQAPPVPPPARPAAPAPTAAAAAPSPAVTDYGVDLAKLGTGPERHVLTGQEVSREQALAAISQGGRLVDDSQALRVTVIGADEARRRRVLRDLDAAPALADLRPNLLVQGYAPDDPMIRSLGFAPGGPAIYVQTKAGQVLGRFLSYPGPEALAEELRRLRPDYNPNRDPILGRRLARRALDQLLPSAEAVVALAVLGCVAVALFFRRAHRSALP